MSLLNNTISIWPQALSSTPICLQLQKSSHNTLLFFLAACLPRYKREFGVELFQRERRGTEVWLKKSPPTHPKAQLASLPQGLWAEASRLTVPMPCPDSSRSLSNRGRYRPHPDSVSSAAFLCDSALVKCPFQPSLTH